MFFVLGAENYDQAKSSGKISLETFFRHFGRVAQQIKVLGVLFPQKSVGLIGIWS